VFRCIDRATQSGNIVENPGRRLVVHHQHRPDRVLAILTQPDLELCGIDGAAPIIGECLDIEPEGLAAHAPIQREKAALDDQYLIAG
jgi:hypothetical protein